MSQNPVRIMFAAVAVLIVALAVTSIALAQAGSDPQDAEEGARLYAENCAVCHGVQGEGRIGATLSQDWPSIRPDLAIRAAIENGVAGSPMPAWSQDKGGPLAAAQIEALVVYILTWESGKPYVPAYYEVYEPREPITPPPYSVGDPNVGAVLYDVNCAFCHGRNGEGRIGVTLAKNWPSIRADLSIKTTIENGISGSVMPAWSQANGGPLNDQDIQDVVAFILELPVVSEEGSVPTVMGASNAAPGGFAGVAATVILFALMVGFILFLQQKQPA